MFIELQCHTSLPMQTAFQLTTKSCKQFKKRRIKTPKWSRKVQNQSKILQKNGGLTWFHHLFIPVIPWTPPGETKVQLQGTIANAQKMMGDDFEFLGFSVGFWDGFWFRTRWWGMRMARFLQREVESESRMNVSVGVFWHTLRLFGVHMRGFWMSIGEVGTLGSRSEGSGVSWIWGEGPWHPLTPRGILSSSQWCFLVNQ